MSKKKIISLILSSLILVSTCIVGAVSAFAAEEETVAPGSKGEIDVYLIAGQSNAVGYGSDGLSASIMNDPRYTNGFKNVLYMGVAEGNDYSDFVPVTVGLGKTTERVGAEVGIASVVGDTDRNSAIIKHAVGGSFLYPTTDGTPAATYGTWTPPSYIEKYGVSTENNKTGDIYEGFINTVTSGIAKLVEDGYIPVIKGVWWMQGCAETPYEARAKAYEELLTTLISDMRRDLGAIVNADLSALPFVIGKITRNPNHEEQPEFVYLVNEAQVAVTSKVNKTYIVDTTGLRQLDGWHYSADAQHWLGQQFISTVVAASGQYGVTMSGMNVSMAGGGAKSEGESVTVTFTPYENCTITSVKMQIGAAEAVSVELDQNNSYTFTMPKDEVIFKVDAVDPGAVTTEYGIIPSRFNDSQKYPFVLFKNGEMLQVFEHYSTFINANNLTDCTLLMRRDYSTTEGASSWGLRNTPKLTLDLGGFTLTRGDNHLFQALGKTAYSTSTTLRITNGTLKTVAKKTDGTSTSPLIVFNNDSTCTVSDTFEFILDGITIDVSSGRGIATCYNDGVAGSNSRIILNDCTIYRGSSTTSMTLFSLTDSDSKNDVEVIINGGKLVADSLSGLTIATFNDPTEVGKGSDDKLILGKGNDGKEFKIELPEDYTVPTTIKFAFSDGGYYPMNPETDEETGKKNYTLVNLGTPYGDIDPQYLSVTDYPFALFKNGTMIYGFSDWKVFIDTTARGNSNYQTGCTLLLRRDYSTSEASGNCWALSYISDIVIDLGTHTFTRGNNHLFNAISHGNAANTTKVTVKNGTLKGNFYKDGTTTAVTSLLTFNNDSNSTSNDTYVFNFDGVRFDITEGRGIIQSTSNSSYKTGKTTNTVNFNNCEFIRGNMTNTMTLFNLSNVANRNDIAVSVNGGKLIVSNNAGLTNLKFADFSEGTPSPDSFKVSADFEVVIPSTATVPVAEYVFTDGTYFLGKKGVNTDSTVSYTFLDVEVLKTAYGNIKIENASAEDYPFVLFKNGEMIHAFRDWQVFIDTDMRTTAAYQTGCTLLLRRDYSTTETAKNCWALSWLKDISIDLGGNTLTRGNTHLFNAISHGSLNTTTVITIFNGTLRADLLKSDGNSTSAAICFNNDNASTSTDTYIFNLNGLTLDVSSGRGLISSYDNGTATSRVDATINCNDCTIYRGAKTGTITLFALQDSNNRNDVKVFINGGKLETTKTLDGIVFATYNDERVAGEGAPDKLVFGKGSDGKYIVITAPKDASDASLECVFNNADGIECVFVKASENDANANYTLLPEVMLGYKIKTSVSLWSNFVYNIYVPESNFVKAFIDGKEAETTFVTIDGENFYHIAVNLPVAKSLDNIKLTVTLNAGDNKTVDAAWTLDVLSYAKAVLASDFDDVTKTLMKDMLVYALTAYTHFEEELESAKATEVAAIINGYTKEMPESNAVNTASGIYFNKVEISLDEVPSFRFYLNGSYTAEDFAFKVGTRNVSADVVNDEDGNALYLEITMYAYMMLDTVSYTVTDKATNEEVTEQYNLYSYYESVTDPDNTESTAELVAIVEGLMKYSVSAKNYRSSVINP